jgi:hypothetical protein
MPGRKYLREQAVTLLKFARATNDPDVAAGLLDKAATLREQVEKAADRGPHAPDIKTDR